MIENERDVLCGRGGATLRHPGNKKVGGERKFYFNFKSSSLMLNLLTNLSSVFAFNMVEVSVVDQFKQGNVSNIYKGGKNRY
jgi:hypothetical protein